MAEIYQGVHAVASFYADGFGKSCPNSIVEGLACGIPALVSDTCGIAGLIADHGAGIAAPREPGEIAAAVDRMRSTHRAFSRAARELAETTFAMDRFLDEYATLYGTLLGSRGPVPLRQRHAGHHM
jgi:glycosyltransferase involved in cell wall biosynthesis